MIFVIPIAAIGAATKALGMAASMFGGSGAGTAASGAGLQGLMSGLGGKGGAGGGPGGGPGGSNGAASAVQGGIGAFQLLRGLGQQKKADAMTPLRQDPIEQRNLRAIQREKRALRAGTGQAAEMNALKEALRQGTAASYRMGGGTRGLNQLNRMFGEGVRSVGAAGAQQALALGQQETALGSRMAQRGLELGLLEQNRLLARSAQNIKEGKSNIGGALARSLDPGNPAANPYLATSRSMYNTQPPAAADINETTGIR